MDHECANSEVFKWVESKPVLYTTEDPRGSTTIVRLSEETGRKYSFEVDYRTVLEFRYYSSGGPEAKPPDRAYEKQIYDWTQGYMWGRFNLAENCGTPYKRTAPEGQYAHWFWVKYKAVLYDYTYEPDKATVEIKLGETLLGKIFNSLDKFKMDTWYRNRVISHVSSYLSTQGYTVLDYKIVDNTLVLTTQKFGSPAFPILAAIIAAVLIVWGLAALSWVWKDYRTKQKVLENDQALMGIWNKIYEDSQAEGKSVQESIDAANRGTDYVKEQQEYEEGFDWSKLFCVPKSEKFLVGAGAILLGGVGATYIPEKTLKKISMATSLTGLGLAMWGIYDCVKD